MRRLLVVLAGCYTGSAEAIANQAPAPKAALMTAGRTHFGPVDATTPATLVPLRRAFAGFTVRPLNDTSLSYKVLLGDEEIAWVIPEDGAIYNVHALSGKVAIEGRPWRAGAPLADALLIDTCECWGDNPTCWHIGDVVAVNLERSCDDVVGELDRRTLRTLDGVKVQRIVWSPRGFDDAATP